MSNKDIIRGKVASILNTREVTLNVGDVHGVKMGMFFDIFPKAQEEVKDPDSGELIGVVRRPKVRVQIADVEQRYSIARTYRMKTRRTGISFWAGLQGDTVREPETLRKKDAEFEDMDEFDSYVEKGDPVEQVVND